MQQLPALGVSFGRRTSIALILAVIGTLWAPLIVQLSRQGTDPSFIDNHPPAGSPRAPVSLSDVERFRKDLGKFIDENFGLRAELVTLNVRLHAAIGMSGVPGLVMGKNGWFFLKSDHAVVEQFRGLNRFTEKELDAWIDDMDSYRRWLEDNGSAFMIVVVPNQQTIYPDYMPMYANRVWPETRLDQVVRRLRERRSALKMIDLRPELWSARKTEQVFHKTENHWNALGALAGYSAIMEHVKSTFPHARTLTRGDFDLAWSTVTWRIPPASEIAPILTPKASSRVIDTEVLGRTGPEVVTKTRTDLALAPDVLVYGDSFAAAGLIALFRESFRSTIFLQTNHAAFPYDLVKQQRPNLVIFELVERYLARGLNFGPELERDRLLKEAPPYQEAQKMSEVIAGAVDGVEPSGDFLMFSGWAMDKEASAPARAVFAYYDREPIGASRMSHLRPDVAAGLADQKAGFRIAVPRNLNLDDVGRLRFFGICADGSIRGIAIHPPVVGRLKPMLRAGQ